MLFFWYLIIYYYICYGINVSNNEQMKYGIKKTLLITLIKKSCENVFCFVSLKKKVNTKKMSKEKQQDGLTSHFGLTKVHKVGKTNKANRVVRIEHYKELAFNNVLQQMKKTDRAEKQRNDSRAKR